MRERRSQIRLHILNSAGTHNRGPLRVRFIDQCVVWVQRSKQQHWLSVDCLVVFNSNFNFNFKPAAAHSFSMLYVVQRGHIILTCTRHPCNVCVRTDDIIAHELLLERIQSKYIVLAPVQRHDMATVSNSKMIFFVRSMIRKQ